MAFAREGKNLRWKILHTSWSSGHELAYQEFIHTLGVARKKNHCHTTDQCLRSPIANPLFYKMNPNNLKNIFADCADLPYVLRAYFSWMNDLPFAFATDLVEAKTFSRKILDIRYSRYGNIVTAKQYVKNGDNINKIIEVISGTISTASYRTNASLNDSGKLFRDTYPVEIERKSIVPGTVLYDPNGHVAVVYEVTSNGKILMIDAHPDNSLTAITYGEKFSRSSVKVGAGFSNFRPFEIERGSVNPKKNSELEGYSLLQFGAGPFVYKGEVMTFYEYVRAKLADGVIIYNPIGEFTDYMNSICQDVKDREVAVNVSLIAGLQNQSHPYLLPANIYGTDGDWETYASPSRDARLKASVRETRKYLAKVINGYLNHHKNIYYEGGDLVRDLREIYQAKVKSCSLTAIQGVSLDLDFVLQNLFALSFDPYHCALLRWGVTDQNGCNSSANKLEWYAAEQGLRNRIDRDYTLKMDYDVKSLPSAPVSQVDKPDLSFHKILEIL